MMMRLLPQQDFLSTVSDSMFSVGSSFLPTYYTSENKNSDDYVVSSAILTDNPWIETVHQGVESACNLLDYEENIFRRERTLNCAETRGKRQFPLIAILIAALRRSLHRRTEEPISMDIGCPTNVRHVNHVTFDRFNGFLGLPVEFELEIPRRVPSASASVFGVSPESMQCSYDVKGNSVPTILLLMQERLYSQGGLQVEGIFRIDAENNHEEYVREQLNKGIVPGNIDLHCLAGMIKAWFRELPTGVLDSFTTKQLMQSHSEVKCVELLKLLPPTEASLLDWAVNLMADVARQQAHNKMNARNIAMIFAPNMTQITDSLTALKHVVQVMNFLKRLILKTLKDQQEAVLDRVPYSH